MPFFKDTYHSIRHRTTPKDDPGLREAQLGAAYAAVSHFTRSSEPAIVVMPTGCGKTAVMQLLPFLLRANRVLVVAPSVVLRGQLFNDFSTFERLKDLGVLPEDLRRPFIRELEAKITSTEDWQSLRVNDIVVSTPFCISPALEEIPVPPADLFDVVLVDEAHHAPARTWNALLEALAASRRVLATATPFRSDSREIRGKIVYYYPIADAVRERIFGQMEYVRVEADADDDQAIARETARVFNADFAADLAHLVLVRADSKVRAAQLEGVYARETDLKLARIDSSVNRTKVNAILDDLRARRLDGVICVDMLGEGVDLPELKIAAVHSPHKSLGVTLQFIGRFARTNRPDVGTAKFVAVETSIKGELDRLYKEGAVWKDLVPALVSSKIDRELSKRQQLDRFKPQDDVAETLKDLSLFALQPYHHARVYSVTGPVDLARKPGLPPGFVVEYRALIEDDSCVVFITRHIVQPRWSASPTLASFEYNLFIVFHDRDHQLLFVHTSLDSPAKQHSLAQTYTDSTAIQLSMSVVNRVLLNLENLQFPNIGLRNRNTVNSAVAYETLTGRRVQEDITATDGRRFHQGHVFARGEIDHQLVSIGYSGNAKVWSNQCSSIPELLEWYAVLGERLSTERTVITNSPLDYLPVARDLKSFPSDIMAAEWDGYVYEQSPTVRYRFGDGIGQAQLLDFDLVVDRASTSRDELFIIIENEDIRATLKYRLAEGQWFAVSAPSDDGFLTVSGRTEDIPIAEFLNDNPLSFYCADFSTIYRNQVVPGLGKELARLGADHFECVDWGGAGISITLECPDPKQPSRSVHEYLHKRLLGEDGEVVFYDHCQGEAADLIVLSRRQTQILVDFYHCKGSGSATAGSRLNDAYEVCGQVVKSVRLVRNLPQIAGHIKRRNRLKQPRYLRGADADLDNILATFNGYQVEYRVNLVQPGFALKGLSEPLISVLAAANDYLIHSGARPIRVLCSP